MVKINGTPTDVSGKTIREFLSATGYDTTRIAIECNGEIIPKTQYGSVILADGDSLEIVSFVGGG